MYDALPYYIDEEDVDGSPITRNWQATNIMVNQILKKDVRGKTSPNQKAGSM